MPRPLDDTADVFDEPLEKAPHYERNDRLDSAAGYLYEDNVEDIWDKHDASGLVWYTDAAFWDRRAGDLDERAHDGWDVEAEQSEGSCSSWESEESTQPVAGGTGNSSRRRRCRFRGVPQSDGLASVRRGAAGQIMRRWGHACGSAPSDALLAVIEGMQPNMSGTGLGWVGGPRDEHRKRKETAVHNGNKGEWITIGSVFDKVVAPDKEEEELKRRCRREPSRGIASSFRADPGGLFAERRRLVRFVPEGRKIGALG